MPIKRLIFIIFMSRCWQTQQVGLRAIRWLRWPVGSLNPRGVTDQLYIRALAPEWSDKALWLYWLVLYTGIIPCPVEKYFIHQVSLLIPNRTSKVVLTRREDDEPVVMTTHGGWLSDVINPQSICCDLHASSSSFSFQGCENEDILKILP